MFVFDLLDEHRLLGDLQFTLPEFTSETSSEVWEQGYISQDGRYLVGGEVIGLQMLAMANTGQPSRYWVADGEPGGGGSLRLATEAEKAVIDDDEALITRHRSDKRVVLRNNVLATAGITLTDVKARALADGTTGLVAKETLFQETLPMNAAGQARLTALENAPNVSAIEAINVFVGI
jgi:hypothetical protein